ncbi:MAG: sensor histidine kinase [Sphaerobacteraceae bacterium]|nr:MAG: sensor histidine kinase [Sphaerobacteraceae bacterium]
MPSQLPERLSTILANVEQAIANAEAGVAGSARELGKLVDSIQQEREHTQSEIEQLTLDRLVQETSGKLADQSSEAQERSLRAAQTELSNSLGRVTSLQQRVVDFEHLLTSARQQFSVSEELPGIEDARDLTQRQSMIRAKEEERRRLSREIHDGPAQVLANAIIGLEFIERSLRQSEATADAPAVEEVERIKASMRDGLSEIRRFIFDLRPTMLAQRGLIGTVEHYISAYKIFLPDEISLKLPEAMPELTPEQELTAFRVIQESLQNVHRHSDATRVSISIESQEREVNVEVRDNGRGFDPASVRVRARGGAGIVGMRERAEVIGARLDVDSSSGSGCQVSLIVPIAMRTSGDPAPGMVDQRRPH